jgi:hypothetical protein
MWKFQLLFRLIVALSLGALVSGCYSEEDGLTVYTIPKQAHYSVPRKIEAVTRLPLQFHVKFDSSAIYDNDSDDINKLYGFTDCNSTIHKNSARFGWRWHNDKLELWAYTYADGKRDYQFISDVPINEWLSCRISCTEEFYYFEVDNSPWIVMKRGTTCETGMYLLSYPYFGGNLPAPHDITIAIK